MLSVSSYQSVDFLMRVDKLRMDGRERQTSRVGGRDADDQLRGKEGEESWSPIAMPFIGKDWRAPGETWVRIPQTNGWERSKLRPVQITEAIAIPCASGSFDESPASSLDDTRSSCCEDSSDDDHWVPHCFVKSKTNEFIGCTSMSEAFHRLDLARAVGDIRRFSYVCKVVSILVEEKLRNLSATARKALLSILTAIVLRATEEDLDVSTARQLLTTFSVALDGHVCGSPQLTARHQLTVDGLLDAVTSVSPQSLFESDESAMTFLDLPREIISQVLSRLPEPRSILDLAKAHTLIEKMVEEEDVMWRKLAHFHFNNNLIDIARRTKPSMTWRETFFHLKKMHGLREVYADLIHICCHCKALFWKSLGHPCLRPSSPSVRVTPAQFVDMLLLL